MDVRVDDDSNRPFRQLADLGEQLRRRRSKTGVDQEDAFAADLHRDVAFVLRKMADDKGLRFSGTVEQGLVEVVSDCLKLREIALNLGTNAVKYTRFGSVSLRFARHGAECWMLEVDDTGQLYGYSGYGVASGARIVRGA